MVIDLTQLNSWLGVIVSLASLIGTILVGIKWFLTKPIIDKIDQMDKSQCMNYLIEFLNDVKNGERKNEYQLARAHEIYAHYTIDLKGNSYVHKLWKEVME